VVQAAHDVAEQIATLQQLRAEQTQIERQLADVDSQNRRADRRRHQGLDDDRTWLGLQLQLDQQRDAQVQLNGQLLATHLGLIYALGGGYHDANVPALPAGGATAQDASQ
jgi:outer membrane protein TolC